MLGKVLGGSAQATPKQRMPTRLRFVNAWAHQAEFQAIHRYVLSPLHVAAASLCSAPIQQLHFDGKPNPAMRAETEKLVDEIKQGITLLRRHL
jgi:hypothetical protein